LTDLGYVIESDCAGQGACGRCKIKVSGRYNAGFSPHVTDEELSRGICLSCTTIIEGDMTVEFLREFKVSQDNILQARPGELFKVGHWEISPRIKKVHLQLSPPDLGDCISDLERVKRKLSAKGFPVDHFYCSLDLLNRLPLLLRDHDWGITLTLMETRDSLQVLEMEAGDETGSRYGLAVDVGTTTVVAYLVDMLTGKKTAVAADYNRQISCGDDVISRMIYAQKGGRDKLRDLVVDTINSLVDRVCRKAGITPDQIDSLTAAGNTTMTHLLLGLETRFIRQEPYIPVANHFPIIKTADVGIKVNRHARLYCFPCISSYVGGDITAGVLRSEMYKKAEITLFIDIGTNGEIVLGNSDWLMTASCSAGPAFEGGGIACGMRATGGAIQKITLEPETLTPEISVIGSQRPAGICGSGIIDLLAELFVCGAVNRQGKIDTSLKNDRIREREGVGEYLLLPADQSETGREIFFSDQDIDNLIRAKGAVYSGFRVLLAETGFTFNEVDSFLIAGGVGNYLNLENAVRIGLLPDIPLEKFMYLGNSSVVGAHLALVSQKHREDAFRVASMMTNIELSVIPSFMDEYISSLFLPHTNLSDFPNVAKML
ncbi:MAG: ASKHA domain-containing protein, partial [bacterium]